MADSHQFNIEHAMRYGMAEAVLLDHFNFWLTKNRANDHNHYDGLWWTYNTVKAYSELFPYLTPSKIKSALAHLEEEGIIVSGNYNKVKFDRTKWYALTEKGWALFGKTISEDEQLHLPETANGSDENSQPIPATTSCLPSSTTSSKGRFTPPTREEVAEYAREKGYTSFPVDRFIAYYESNGWMVGGKSKMKNWKASVTSWWLRDHKDEPKGTPMPQAFRDEIELGHQKMYELLGYTKGLKKEGL